MITKASELFLPCPLSDAGRFRGLMKSIYGRRDHLSREHLLKQASRATRELRGMHFRQSFEMEGQRFSYRMSERKPKEFRDMRLIALRLIIEYRRSEWIIVEAIETLENTTTTPRLEIINASNKQENDNEQ